MFTLTFTLLALAPLFVGSFAALVTIVWHYVMRGAPNFAALESSLEAEEWWQSEIKIAVKESAPAIGSVFVIDGTRVFAASYQDAVRIAA